MKRYILILFVLLLFGKGWGQAPLIYEHTYPFIEMEDVRVRGLMEQVSQDSLEVTIEHLSSYHTRMWNSDMVYDVQDWLFGRYRAMGMDSVVLHDFMVSHHDSLFETSDNVIAIQRGVLYPDEYVVCGAHYDSYNNTPGDPNELRAPGADDNATGVAGILETARLLSPYRFDRSIIYANWAAEEIGLKGSAAYAKDCADQLLDIVGYFNLDMTGYLRDGSDMHVKLLYTMRDSILANYVYSFSNTYYPDMPIDHGWLSGGADSDYSSFNRNGYSAVHPFEDTYFCSPYIHTPNDILGLSVNSMEQVKRFTELNLGLVATLAGLTAFAVDDTEGDALMVYPNPTSGSLTVSGLPMREVSIYNLTGQVVYSQSFVGEECKINVGSLVPGIYFVRVFTDNGRLFTRKIALE